MKVKNNFWFVLIMIITSLSVVINYMYFKSLNEQRILIYEFNNSGSLDYPLEKVKEFNHTFPNITVTTLPISLLKARYYLKKNQTNEALSLIYNSIQFNPYIGISEYELARHYFITNIDSMYYYSKRAFNKLPSNLYHTKLYFTALRELKKEKELDSSFNLIKDYKFFEQWKDYIFSKLELNSENRDSMQKLLETNDYFDKKKDEYITLQTLVNIGFDNFTNYKASIIKAEALFDQKRLVESAVIYDEISVKNPSEYLLKENAAIAYYKAGMYQAAINSFKYVIDNYTNRKNAKAEFYLGLTYLTAKNKSLGCRYLTLAQQKSFSGAKKVKENFCF